MPPSLSLSLLMSVFKRHLEVSVSVAEKRNEQEAACTDAYPENLSFSGSSGGALVATVLGTGLQPSDVFEMVLRSPGQRCRRCGMP